MRTVQVARLLGSAVAAWPVALVLLLPPERLPLPVLLLLFLGPPAIALLFALPQLPAGQYAANGVVASLVIATMAGRETLTNPEYDRSLGTFLFGFGLGIVPALLGVGTVGVLLWLFHRWRTAGKNQERR